MKTSVGKIGEELACRYLQDNGYLILSRNYRSRFGEIDIIAKKGNCIAFIEVKYRKNNRFGEGYEAVSHQKMEKIRKTAQFFILSFKDKDIIYRFDVISIDGDRIRHIENAFAG
jgi:putative endonuclease